MLRASGLREENRRALFLPGAVDLDVQQPGRRVHHGVLEILPDPVEVRGRADDQDEDAALRDDGLARHLADCTHKQDTTKRSSTHEP